MKTALIIDNGTSYLAELQKLLSSFSTHISPYNQIQDVSPFDLIILSGGHSYSVLHHESIYKHELNIIRTSCKPIIGICLGFELIAHAFGARLKRMEKKENGIILLQPLQSDSIFHDLPNLEVYENHRWVVEGLGAKLTGVAKSKDGYEIIKHNTHLIYGLQFHPERCVRRTCGDEIFRNLIHKIDMIS